MTLSDPTTHHANAKKRMKRRDGTGVRVPPVRILHIWYGEEHWFPEKLLTKVKNRTKLATRAETRSSKWFLLL
jgi:hypothetical protein